MNDPGYKGLIVDWGGVMTTNLFDTFADFCRDAGIDPDSVRRIFREDRDARQLLVDFECGRIEEAEFEPRFAAMLDVEAEQLVDRMFAGGRADQPMQDAVAAARSAGIRTGLLSNSWGTRRYPRDVLGWLFDAIVLSGDEGIRKPEPEIYTLAAERVGLAPEACVFVDDLEFNLPPAEELGMAVVHHTAAETTIPELERLLGLSLRP